MYRLGKEEKNLSFCGVFNRIYSDARHHTSNECLLNDDDDISSLTNWRNHRKDNSCLSFSNHKLYQREDDLRRNSRKIREKHTATHSSIFLSSNEEKSSQLVEISRCFVSSKKNYRERAAFFMAKFSHPIPLQLRRSFDIRH